MNRLGFPQCLVLCAVATACVVGCSNGTDTLQQNKAATSTGTQPTAREDATVAAGEASVKSRNCARCHGADMSGPGTNLADPGTGIELYPPNLTPDETGIASWSDDQLAGAIRYGFDRDGLKLCPQMKHVSTMSDYEAFSIVMYLRTLPAVSKKTTRSVCPPLKSKAEQASH